MANLNHPNLKIHPVHCLVSQKYLPTGNFQKTEESSQPDIAWKPAKFAGFELNFHKSSLVQTLYLSFWRLYYCLIYESNVARSAKSWCLNKKQLTLRKDPSCTMKNNSSICFLMIIISKIIVQICSVCKAYLIKYHHVVFHKMLT